MLGRLRRDRLEMRDVDDRGDCCNGERTLRGGVCTGVLAAVIVACLALVHDLAIVTGQMTLDDRAALVRAEGQLQAIGLRRRQHETDRQKGTRHQ